jgi:F-type H+-transporting ATPase subunit a
MLALEFPPIENLVLWPAYFGEGTIFEFNKIALITLLSMAIPTAMFLVARKELVPAGLQHITEGTVTFVQKQIILPAIGPDGLRYTPLLLSLFMFLFFGSLFEVIPTFHMPSTARMAVPGVLALLVLVTFVAVGVKHNGAGTYFKSALFPPGLPKGLYLLVTPIELLSTFIIRPFSLAVRIFANLLAGHILIVTFSVLCITLWQLSPLVLAMPFAFVMLSGVVAFEIGVSFLQAFVFSLLTAVYIGGSLHPHH